MILGATIIGSTKISEGMATSNNPWAYLVGGLLVALAIIGHHICKDLKKQQEHLANLDKEHRGDSKKREERLNEQIDKSIAANASLVETQKEIITTISAVQE
ncbi:hypothetical protein [Lysinibacillus sp. LZ02]|uniref:hypothetical protein n=1 Tax=Lysinibacillus sp. LZ02 TaxID=3420668 RepID=UPI003D364A88